MRFHLGVNVFHDVGFSVVGSSGEPIAIYEEPKFTGRKEEYLFPLQSLEQIRKDGFTEFESITWPIEISNVLDLPEEYNFHKLGVATTKDFESYLSRLFNFKNKYLIYHHAAHAESVFYASGFKDAHILVIDGAGEEQSISMFYGDSDSSEGIKECFRIPRSQFSYGHLYGFFTSYLGYSKGASNTHCGKVMGLSSYGKPLYLKELEQLYRNEDSLFPKGHLSTFKFLEDRFGPAYTLSNKFTEEQANIAASLQSYLEQDLARVLDELNSFYPDLPKSENLCLAGGVAMNSVANGKLLFSKKYKDIFVQPASTDAGIAYGAAFYGARMSGNIKKKNAFWGKANFGYECKSDYKDIIDIIDEYHMPLEIEVINNTEEYIAKNLAENKIIAVCRGKQEVGERALGYRSIFALPTVEMRDKVNARIKYREEWRPFAPIILDTYMSKIFYTDRPEPFMTIVYPVKEETPPEIAGIVHVDSTARLQTVSYSSEPYVANILINLQNKFSKPPVILNTSFNINGQSMVRTEYDALVTFLATDIDELFINNNVIRRSKHAPPPDPSGITPLDRILEMYMSKKMDLCVIHIATEDEPENNFNALFLANCIQKKFSYSKSTLSVYSNYDSDKQKWHQESIIAKTLSRRIKIENINDNITNLQSVIASSDITILITNGQLLPIKIGHTMNSFKKPNLLISDNKLEKYFDLLRDDDLIIDIQKRPIKKIDSLSLGFGINVN